MSAVKAIPDNYPRVMPYLCVNDAPAAIEFYKSVLGFTERGRMLGPDNKVAHCELELGTGVLMLSDEFPEMSGTSAKTVGGSPVTITVYVEDVDDVYKRAVAAGATSIHEPTDQFYGDRSGGFVDPFGHRWNIQTHVEDVDTDEMNRRMGQMGA